MKKILDAAAESRLAAAYRAGVSAGSLRERFGVGATAVTAILRKAGIVPRGGRPPRSARLDPSRVDAVIDEALAGDDRRLLTSFELGFADAIRRRRDRTRADPGPFAASEREARILQHIEEKLLRASGVGAVTSGEQR